MSKRYTLWRGGFKVISTGTDPLKHHDGECHHVHTDHEDEEPGEDVKGLYTAATPTHSNI